MLSLFGGVLEGRAAPAATPRREVIYRHRLPVRLTHWVNALAIFILIGSGLNIFNAHPQLYWGQKGGEYDTPLLALQAVDTPEGLQGVTLIGPLRFDTTGVLGASRQAGELVARGWPAWINCT